MGIYEDLAKLDSPTTKLPRRSSETQGGAKKAPNERTGNRTTKRTQPRTPGRTRQSPDVAPAERTRKAPVTMISDDELAPAEPTERYSFEIYTSQKKRLNRIRHQYNELTGRTLPASRILRDALEPSLRALEAQLDKVRLKVESEA